MGPEKPPRRSKADQQPLTIDLEANSSEAQDAGAAGDSPRETPSNAAVNAATPPDAFATEAGDAEAVRDEPVSQSPASSGPASSDPVSPGYDSPSPASADSVSGDPVSGNATPDERSADAASAFTEEPASAEPARSTTVEQRGASASGALAAGILGGLVALLAAGGLQYAGVLPALGPGGANSATEQSLVGEIEAIKTQLAETPATAPAPVDLQPIETRLAALEQQPADSGASADVSGLEAEVTNLTSEIATLKSTLADLRQSAETERSELSTRIEAAEKKIDEPASDVQLARAVAVTALKTAIDRGGPFLAELDALKSIAADDPAVSGLAGDAATGVVSRADLARTFPAAADAMLDAAEQKDPDQGIFGRLVDSASSAIRVRPVGSVEGEGPSAVIARIEDKLANGDLKGASLEWETLPDPAKAAGTDFKNKLDQRIRVEGLIDGAVSGAMTTRQGSNQG
ncbi:COG4223 family protein [Rhizobium sp. Root482]|uniref:COG4223 family protein n=1 Tax=Rhizobium sp. Root482 TaxID=1736543 RepID=UPI0006F68F33|nr:COG4223 family protein [Rhizobium sp. Root482]KQY26030.1 hypothetical protein ASD31_20680 [Rhizobium sp. Root482]